MFGFNSENKETIKNLERIRDFLIHFLQDFVVLENKVPKDLFEITCFYLKEAIDIYDSIIVLQKRGHVATRLILARSLLENSINLQYVYREESERRAQNFLLYPFKEYLDQVKSYPDIPEHGEELIRKMRKELEGYKPSGDSPYHWDGVSIRKMFIELNLKPLYGTLYRRLSGFAHGKFHGGNFDQDRPYTNHLKGLLTRELLVIVLDSIRVISERFDMESSLFLIENFNENMHVAFATNPKKSQDGIL